MMSRLLFEKTGESIYISHLDLMRVFQRAFRRAGLLLRHSQGFTPRAIVSIALPLALGTESRCELLDFELQEAGTVTPEQLNAVLPAGIRVLEVYEMGRKLKELSISGCRWSWSTTRERRLRRLWKQYFVRRASWWKSSPKRGAPRWTFAR